jgi:hypothetical protein
MKGMQQVCSAGGVVNPRQASILCSIKAYVKKRHATILFGRWGGGSEKETI